MPTSSKIFDQVSEHIDKVANPNRNLGRVHVANTRLYNYNEAEKVDTPLIDQIVWTKKAYIYYRPIPYELSPSTFADYYGRKIISFINAGLGNFQDYNINQSSNIEYSVDVYVDNSKTILLEIESPLSQIAIYSDLRLEYTSLDNLYKSGKHYINLSQGWHTIRILYYSRSILADDEFSAGGVTGNKFSLGGDISKYIFSWRISDYEPPSTPIWATDSVVTGYVDPVNHAGLKNVLTWNRNTESDFAGNGIYRQETLQAKDLSTIQPLFILSGWSTGFVVPGLVGNALPVGISVVTPTSTGNVHVVSGHMYLFDPRRTVIFLSGSSWSGNNFDLLYFKNIRHLQDRDVSPTDGAVISWEHLDVQQGVTYSYLLDAYDHRGNRSEKTNVESVVAGDTVRPAIVSGIEYDWGWATQQITLSWINPTDDDFAGVHVYHDDPTAVSNNKIGTVLKDGTSFVVTKTRQGQPIKINESYVFNFDSFDRNGNSLLSQNPIDADLPDITVPALVTSSPGGGILQMITNEGLHEIGGGGLLLNYGMITAGSLQTASTGKRIIISGADNDITFYNPSNTEILRIDDDNVGFSTRPMLRMSPNGGLIYMLSGTNSTIIVEGQVDVVQPINNSTVDITTNGFGIRINVFGSDDIAPFIEPINYESYGTDKFVVSGYGETGIASDLVVVSGIYSPSVKTVIYTDSNNFAVGESTSATQNIYIADSTERIKLITSFYKDVVNKTAHISCKLRNATAGENAGLKLQLVGGVTLQGEIATASDSFDDKVLNVPISSLSNSVITVYVKMSGTASGNAEMTDPFIWID